MLKLTDKWVWDFWFCQAEDIIHIFYLQAPKSLGDERLRHFNATIGHARSTDWINWEILPDALGPGALGEWDDLATWTGSTFRRGENWYLFYTGVSRTHREHVQRIGVALSKDLIHWEKYKGNPILTADPAWYELFNAETGQDEAWRDPWIFEYDGQFHAFITARVNHGEPDGRGVIAHAESSDLLNWKIKAPVTLPGNYYQLEVPQLIEVDSIPYLVFSTDKFTHSKAVLKRTGTPPLTGSACYEGATPLGPFTQPDKAWLFGDEDGQLYSGKFIGLSESGWRLMAFENYGPDGEFMGRIPDPFSVKLS